MRLCQCDLANKVKKRTNQKYFDMYMIKKKKVDLTILCV